MPNVSALDSSCADGVDLKTVATEKWEENLAFMKDKACEHGKGTVLESRSTSPEPQDLAA